MASIINATTSSGVQTTADNSGILQLQSNGTTIATISSTGVSTQVGAPAFSGYLGSNQTLSNATSTKVQINSKQFDTANNFDFTTNYRFTPTVAGYYSFSAIGLFGQGSNSVQCYIQKNGSTVAFATGVQNQASGSGNVSLMVNGLVYMNGSTDYVEFYAYQSSGGNLTLYASGAQSTTFTGFLARSA